MVGVIWIHLVRVIYPAMFAENNIRSISCKESTFFRIEIACDNQSSNVIEVIYTLEHFRFGAFIYPFVYVNSAVKKVLTNIAQLNDIILS